MTTKIQVSVWEKMVELAGSKNAATTAIHALRRYFGKDMDHDVTVEDLGKLTVDKLAHIPGVGKKNFVLICETYRELVGKK